jgi:hypothetical protein
MGSHSTSWHSESRLRGSRRHVVPGDDVRHDGTVETQTTPRKRGAANHPCRDSRLATQWAVLFCDPESGFSSAPASFRYCAVTSFGERKVRL